MIAESPQALSGEVMASRIFSPFAYPLPRRTRVVPIVAAEADRFAPVFPLVWRLGGGGPELVVLRTLMEDGTGFPPGTERALVLLPLILQAYPFVFPDGPLAARDNRRLIDVASADEPTDMGMAITTADGRPSRGTELRLRALDLFERDAARTLAIGRMLAELQLLEPWPLAFDLGHGQRCEIDDLLVIAPAAFDTPRLAPLLAHFGIAAARLVGAHRLSLFRAAALLAAARTACAPRPGRLS